MIDADYSMSSLETIDTQPSLTFDEEQDTTTWNLTANGVYTAKSAYSALMFGRIETPIFSEIWDTKAIPKCKFHSWLLFHNKCLTADNLAKRGWPHNALCSFCNSSPETAVHLHICCPYAQDCWKEILNKTNLLSIQACWAAMTRSAPAQLIRRWRSLALLTWWNLWKTRNNRIFNHKDISSSQLADMILQELAQWRAAGILITVWPAGA